MWQNQKERCRNTTEKHAAACVYVRKATESAQPVCNSVPPPYTSWTTLFWDMASQQKRKRERTLSYIKRERKALAKLGRCCTDDTGVVVDFVVVVVSRVGWCVILVLVGAVAVWPCGRCCCRSIACSISHARSAQTIGSDRLVSRCRNSEAMEANDARRWMAAAAAYTGQCRYRIRQARHANVYSRTTIGGRTNYQAVCGESLYYFVAHTTFIIDVTRTYHTVTCLVTDRRGKSFQVKRERRKQYWPL